MLDSEVKLQKYARPPDYCAQTIIHMGHLAVMSLLDYGATCSGMPAEVALTFITHALSCVKTRQYSRESNAYPVVRMHKYEVAPTVDGIAAGKRIEIRYAIVMRCEFVPVGMERGPFRDLYFKIFPKGTCNIPGCIIGFPVLDVMPYGLGHSMHSTVHVFEELGVSLPRLEAGRRAEYGAGLARYLDKDGSECFGVSEKSCRLDEFSCAALRAASSLEDAISLKLSATAVADCADVLLQPGEEAMIPAVWDRIIPGEDFLAEDYEEIGINKPVESIPGVMPGGEQQTMVCVRNTSLDQVTVSRGRPLMSAVDTLTSLAGQGPELESEKLAMMLLKRRDFDYASVLRVLRLTKVQPSATRANVIPEGMDKVRSQLLGLYRHGPEIGVTKATAANSWLTRYLLGFLRANLPSVPCTSIQVNVGFACRPHVDRSNHGPSAIVGLGSYAGGGLWVEAPGGSHGYEVQKIDLKASKVYPAGKIVPGVVFDIHEKWATFDGNLLHYTEAFEGERFSLVYFVVSDYDKSPSKVKSQLYDSGFDFDWDPLLPRGCIGTDRLPQGTVTNSSSGGSVPLPRAAPDRNSWIEKVSQVERGRRRALVGSLMREYDQSRKRITSL